ncbi:MAG: DegT/DnrJ/EryC1/StrS family aminotransferase [Thaumarchaeota archaeon]|nr:DegT/DnrJ/EryC1/StrS family aminotransferase [Nitrososphaerota archaeon]MCL5318572.1 DegT/DnrJ/EryC1/StrS family aminotransferase [Nitrososphaerota archaeon]
MLGEGPKVGQFESELKNKFGLKYVLALNSGTSALRLALAVGGVGPNDEVITTPFTALATNTSILEQGAKPVFADINYETSNIDPADIEKHITRKTKAIICVHYGGYPCDMDEINEIARDHDLLVIEDAAHALGATYKGKVIGTISKFTAFSFQAIKHITTGDGGMLTLLDSEKYEEARRRRWFGIDRAARKPSVIGYDTTFDITEAGYKYHMNDIAATIGLEQLKYFDAVFKRRAEIANIYREQLSDVNGIVLSENSSDRKNANWLFPLHVERREDFAKMMSAKGIEVSVVHWRNDRYSIFGGLRKDLPNLEKFSKTIIHIPLHQDLTDSNVEYIIDSIKGEW